MPAKTKKVLVIGDACIDTFIYCDIERICPEAPVPVLKPTHKTSNFGMALNVVQNLASLGVEVFQFVNQNQIQKIRYVDNRSGQMVVRVDLNDYADRIDLDKFPSTDGYDAIVISDYAKGFLTEEDIEWIAKQDKCPIFLDTKKKLTEWWLHNITFIKINEFEYRKNYEIKPDYEQFKEKLIVTHGSKGCEYMGKLYPVPLVSVKDVSGAGDTFLAGLVYSYIHTKDIERSIKFANECSTKVVQVRGVSSDLSDMKL